MSSTNPEFIISILVKGNNMLGAKLDQAAREIDKVTKAHEKGTKAEKAHADATKKTASDMDMAIKKFEKYTKAIADGTAKTGTAEKQLKSFGRQFDDLGSKADAGSKVAEVMYRMGASARKLADDVAKGRAVEQKAERERISAYEAMQRRAITLAVTQKALSKAVSDGADAQVDATKAVEKDTEAKKKQEVATKKAAASYKELREGYKKFIDEVQSGTRRGREAVQFLDDFAHGFREVEADAKKSGDVMSTSYARSAKRVRDVLEKSMGEEKALRERMIADVIEGENRKLEATRARIEHERQAEERARVAEVQANTERSQRRSEERAAAEQDTLDFIEQLRKREQEKAKTERVLADAEIKEMARVEAARASARANDYSSSRIRSPRGPGDDPDPAPAERPRRNFLQRFFNNDHNTIDRITEAANRFDDQMNRSSFSVVKLAGNLRGLVIVGALGFFTQLISVGVALGATLLSIASAAVQAGGALAGALTAGVAQALPVVGLLVAAWGRVGAVFDALKKSQDAQRVAGYDAQQNAQRQADAADAIVSAQEGVADAYRRVTDAQEGLSEARRSAVRQIEDLIAAERQAQLQAESAALAQSDAQKALRGSITSGSFSDLAGNALQVRSTAMAAGTASLASTRAGLDARRAVRGGIEGMPDVVSARKALADAVRGVAQANRSLSSAQRNAAQTTAAVASTERGLQQLLDDLSPAELELYKMLERVVKRYRKVFTGEGGILEPITRSFTAAAASVLALLSDEKLVGAARSLAESIGSQLERIADALTGSGFVTFMRDMAAEAQGNLPVFVGLMGKLATFLMNVARAGSGVFRRLLRDLSGTFENLNDATGIERLERFFDKGYEYAKSFGRLGIALTHLFGAIIGTSAQEGANAVDQLTGQIDKATGWINDNRMEVRQFFSDAREATADIMGVVFDITKALVQMFHKDQVQVFAEAIDETLLPALESFFRILGGIAMIFLKLAGLPFVGDMIEFGIAALLVGRALKPIIGFFGRIIFLVGRLFNSYGIAVTGLKMMERAMGPLMVVAGGLLVLFETMTGGVDGFADALKKLIPMIGLVGSAMAFKALLGGAGGLGALLAGGKAGKVLGKIPGLGKIIGTGAAAAGAGGAAASGGLMKGLLGKFAGKAGWIGLGLTAIAGIAEGIKQGSVSKGLRSFFSNMTFGIVDSVEKSAAKAAERLNQKLNAPTTEGKPDSVDLGYDSGATTSRKNPGYTSGRGGGVSPGLRQKTDDQKDYERLNSAGKKTVDVIRSLRAQMRALQSGRANKTNAFTDLIDQLQSIKDVPEEFKGTVDAVLAQSERLQKGFDMGVPAASLDKFNTVLKGSADLFDDYLSSGRKNLSGIREATKRNMSTISSVLGTESLAGKQALKRNFELAADAVQKAMDDGKISTKTGLAEIRRLMKKSLSLYGIKSKEADRYLDGADTKTGKSDTSGPGDGRGGHTGGFLGNPGERAADGTGPFIGGKATGRGEAVLAAHHQPYVNNALRAVYGWNLPQFFNKVRGQHGDANGYRGLARGGYVQQAAANGGGKNLSSATRAFAERMFKRGFSVTSAFRPGSITSSGNISQHSGGTALDFGSSVNDLRKVWSAVFPLRAQFRQLLGPWGLYNGTSKFEDPGLQADHNDHVHVGLMDSIRGALGRGAMGGQVAAAIMQRIRAPRVKGTFALAGITQGVLNRSTKAANDRLAAIAGDSGGGGDIPAFTGKWTEVMARIARSRSWNLADWKKLVQGESGGNPKALNPSSGAFGLGQFLGATKEAYAKYGATSTSGSKQIRAMAKYISDRYRDPTNALHQWLSRSPHWYAAGGAVDGPGTGTSDSISARLSKGEHVWTASEVAKAGGHQAMYALRKLFGGGGQSMMNRLAGGGVPVVTGQSAQPTSTGSSVYSRDAGARIDMVGVNAELNRAQKIIAGLKTSVINSKFTDSLSRSIDEVIGENGLLDLLASAQERLVSRLSVNTSRATFKIDKTGKVIKALADDKLADRIYDDLRRAYSGLRQQESQIGQSLADVAKRLKNPNISKGERNALTAARRNLETRQRDIQSAIADSIEAQYNQITEQISSRTEKANKVAERGSGYLDLLGRARTLVGGSFLKATGQRSNLSLADSRAGILNTQANSLTDAAQFALKRGRTDEAAEIMAQVADLRMSASEAVAEGIKADVDEVNRQVGRSGTALDLRGRIAEALGRVGDTAKIMEERMTLTRDQIGSLQEQQSVAASRGQFGLVEEIADQIAELETSITELASQRLRDSIEQVNNAVARRSAALDLQGRIADMRERAGDIAGSFGQRGSILGQRGQVARDQIGSLSALLGVAVASGNEGAANELRDQIAELNVQLEENTEQVRSNTNQYRQARINSITARGGFLGGIFGGLGGILTQLAGLNGTTDTAGLRKLLGQSATTLGQTGSGLAGEISGYGINIAGMSPAQIVQALSGVDYDSVQSGMTTEEKDTFQGLINSVIENTAAQLSNTEQIKQLNAPATQSWSSTAWQWFRSAVFNGNGGLLARYQNAGLGITGGMAGTYDPGQQTQSMAAAQRRGSGQGVFAPTIINEEKTVDMDADTLANRLYFRYKNAPTT